MTNHGCRYFRGFSLNLDTGELRQGDRPVALERQPALMLVRLVSGAGHLVTRRELQHAVWPDGTHVDFDRGLNYGLRQIRRALGDDSRAPTFIETVPRQGYRFVAPLESAGPRTVATPTTPEVVHRSKTMLDWPQWSC